MEVATSSQAPPDSGSAEASFQLCIFRSALILCGREIINQAVERDWAGSRLGQNDESAREMVQNGARYIRLAGDNLGEMLDIANWKDILGDDDPAMLVLFGLEGSAIGF
jgi:hypothetical protein